MKHGWMEKHYFLIKGSFYRLKVHMVSDPKNTGYETEVATVLHNPRCSLLCTSMALEE
jgi:hypothetical protein